jgi:hypothetical protein
VRACCGEAERERSRATRCWLREDETGIGFLLWLRQIRMGGETVGSETMGDGSASGGGGGVRWGLEQRWHGRFLSLA